MEQSSMLFPIVLFNVLNSLKIYPLIHESVLFPVR